MNTFKGQLDQLQAEFDRKEMRCNQTLLRCDEKFKSAEKAQRVLNADLQKGVVDENGERQKAINSLREKAQNDKNDALNQLRDLEQRKPELHKAMARREILFSNPVFNNPAFTELHNAQKEKADLIEAYEKKRQALTTRLTELETSPERNTAAVQTEMNALKLVLADPQTQDVQKENPYALNASDPKDALDSKGVNDARQRELSLKAIKDNLALMAGNCTVAPPAI